MNDVIMESTATMRFQTWLMAIFSATALLLAVVGVYSLIAYSVEQRRYEIGVRMALGARPTDIRKVIVWRGMILTLIGIAAGLAAAFNLSKLVSGFLFGVTARDPLVFISATLLLMAVGFLAAWLPSWRVMQINPITLLRHD
jgi:ABC-type antimicrobial peptide transport system permease subunit